MSARAAAAETEWDRILAHTGVPDSGAPPFVIEKRDRSINLSREWDPQVNRTVWTKIYQPVSDEAADEDLSFLCEWETDLLTRATKVKVRGCVRMRESVFKNSPLHRGDTPMGLRQQRVTELRTYDAGPTLDVWKLMKPRTGAVPGAHPFVEQRNFLQLVRGILLALQDFHEKGFVHCDLHPGNIALPARDSAVPAAGASGEYIVLEPDWDNMRVIDLDFSASRAIVPPIPLPHQLSRQGTPVSPMSDHLRLRLHAIDQWLERQGKLDLRYDREFWALSQNNEHLKCFQTLDWREDLYQLGYWLAHVRDSWGGAQHVITTGREREVNRLINEFPEELLEWGGESQFCLDGINWTSSKTPEELPHGSYIHRIDDLLKQLRPDGPRKIRLERTDHLAPYEAGRAGPLRPQSSPHAMYAVTDAQADTPIRLSRAHEKPARRRSFRRPALLSALLLSAAWAAISEHGRMGMAGDTTLAPAVKPYATTATASARKAASDWPPKFAQAAAAPAEAIASSAPAAPAVISVPPAAPPGDSLSEPDAVSVPPARTAHGAASDAPARSEHTAPSAHSAAGGPSRPTGRSAPVSPSARPTRPVPTTAPGSARAVASGLPAKSAPAGASAPAAVPASVIAYASFGKPAPMAASAADSGWIADATGCLIYDQNAEPGESVRWTGDCVGGYASGPGKATSSNLGATTSTQEGYWVRGKLEGNGTMSNRHGSYSGAIVASQRHGQGSFTWPNGNRFQGDFVNDKLTGFGLFTFANGERYEGGFSAGKFHGRGTYDWPNGDRYVGDWEWAERSGKATFVWANGNRYQGDFLKDKMTGHGYLAFSNGDRYQGEFNDNVFSGYGTFIKANGERYQGIFANGTLSGTGTLTLSNGDRFRGNFVDGRPAGFGTYTWSNGFTRQVTLTNDQRRSWMVLAPTYASRLQ